LLKRNYKEIQRQTYLKEKLEDYLKSIDDDSMQNLLIRTQIKHLILTKNQIADTIGFATYGNAKFEKPKDLKDIKKADFSDEEIKELDAEFSMIIETLENQPDENFRNAN
jgi:hypothetical protein